ncbi:type II toxin-antitoxin system HicB family antitoxin [candidate division KSB3 bacterium]|uniref:Type II toxin-antitoxin system HicB family antitoxin n=1 Tax=candidate division KSB3 bacterium TaxID=2044937 RepID=A0A9D5JZS4_9BACT|nr:type II toxin-antitoxin system HicB family antitoxin [candidate division KSB3 bacterium]
MANTYTAILKQDGPWWIGWIAEIPGVNCQEHSKEALLATLQITLQEAIELNRQDAQDIAESDYSTELLSV